MTSKEIPLCTVIISGEKSDDPLSTVIKGGKTSGENVQLRNLAKICCSACAWREEQLRQVKQRTLHTSETDKLLQHVADRIFPPALPVDKENTDNAMPLTERQIKYGSILSHAIKCKTVSYDEPTENVKSQVELLKLHKMLRTSFPILHENFPPTIVNKFSLIFKIPAAEEGQGKKPIMLCSHLDVVPASNHEDVSWKHDPFEGEVIDGVIWGRGAIDNKHNIVGQLGALEEILASGKLPKRTIYLALGHDEEIGGKDGARCIAQILEKDNLLFEYILDEGTMMVSGVIPGYKSNVALIGCAEKGFMNVEMTVNGPGGHSSTPPIDRDNPLKIMSKAIVALESNPVPAHFENRTAFRNTLEYIAKKLSFPFNILFSNLWLFGPLLRLILPHASNGAAASIRTTTAVTKIFGGEKINTLPSEVKAYVNHRVHPNDSIESILEYDRRTINDDRVKLRVMDGAVPASPVSDHRSAVGFRRILNSVEKIFGFIGSPALCVGNTDTRWYWNLSKNIYRFSPVPLTLQETAMFHGVNERISVQSLTLMVDFYKDLIECDD